LGFSWIHETNGICPLERTVNYSGWTYGSEDAIMKAFNTRPIEDALQARIDELVDALHNQVAEEVSAQAEAIAEFVEHIATLEAQLRDIGKESLYRLMLQLSEDVFLAGWYIDLLTVCKDAIEGKRKLPADYTEKLTEYHKLAGGWWDWNDTTQSVMFIPDKMPLPNPPEEKA
jgi:hypothetical protein